MTQLTTTPTSDAAADLAPEVTVEEIAPARKRLTIVVPAKSVDARLEQSMGTLATQTVVPGFRKGKAPRQLLERRFGSTLRAETKTQLVAEAYSKAIEAQKLAVVGEPEPDKDFETLELRPGQPMTFHVMVEVVPDFEVPDLHGLEIRKPVLEITEEHIAEETKRQLYQMGQLHEVKEGFKEGDRLTGNAIVRKEGQDEPIFQTPETAIIMPPEANDGRGTVLGLLIDGLHQLLGDRRVGDVVTIQAVGPEAHEREDVRGAKLTIEFTIDRAHRIEPATVQELIERFSLGTEENFREQIKLALEQRRDAEQAAAMREQVFERLTELVDFPLPEKLSELQITRNLDRQRIDLAYRGLTVEQIEDRVAEIRADSESETRRRLRLMFILHRLAGQYNIQVSEQEVNGYIAAMATQRGERPAALKAELAKTNRLSDVATQIRDHKTADRVIAQAKVTDIAADDWNKLVAEKARASAQRRGEAGGKKSAAATAATPARTTASKSAAPTKSKPSASAAKSRDDDAPKKKPSAKTPKKK